MKDLVEIQADIDHLERRLVIFRRFRQGLRQNKPGLYCIAPNGDVVPVVCDASGRMVPARDPRPQSDGKLPQMQPELVE